MRVTRLALGSIPPLYVPFRFFLTAPWFGVLAALVLIYMSPGSWINRQYPVLTGVISNRGWILVGMLIIPGFACSIILGMLQKIVPFLVYLHLQRACMTNMDTIKSLPNMHMIISADRSKWLLRFHITAILAMMSAVLYGPLTGVAALALPLYERTFS